MVVVVGGGGGFCACTNSYRFCISQRPNMKYSAEDHHNFFYVDTYHSLLRPPYTDNRLDGVRSDSFTSILSFHHYCDFIGELEKYFEVSDRGTLCPLKVLLHACLIVQYASKLWKIIPALLILHAPSSYL